MRGSSFVFLRVFVLSFVLLLGLSGVWVAFASGSSQDDSEDDSELVDDEYEEEADEQEYFGVNSYRGQGVYGSMKPYTPKVKEIEDSSEVSSNMDWLNDFIGAFLKYVLLPGVLVYAVKKKLFNGFFYNIWLSIVELFKMLFGKSTVAKDGDDDNGDTQADVDVRQMTLEEKLAAMEAAVESGAFSTAVKYAYEIASDEAVARGLVSADDSLTPTERMLAFKKCCAGNAGVDSSLASVFSSMTWVYLQSCYGNSSVDDGIWRRVKLLLSQFRDGLKDVKIVAAKTMAVFVALLSLASCREVEPPYNRWDVRFSPDEEEPFDNWYFDNNFDYLYNVHDTADLLPYGYVCISASTEFLKASDDTMNVLIQRMADDKTPLDPKSLARRLKMGLTTVVASEVIALKGRDDINIGEFYSVDKLVAEVNADKELKTTSINVNLPEYTRQFDFPAVFCTRRINRKRVADFVGAIRSQPDCAGVKYHFLALAQEDKSVIACQLDHKSGGKLILVSVPLLFTNYGSVRNDGVWLDMIVYLLGEDVWKRPLRRVYSPSVSLDSTIYATEYPPVNYDDVSRNDDDGFPLGFLFTAILLTLILLPIALRRKHRSTRILARPQNRKAEYIRKIGELFVYQEEYTAIVQKRAAVFFTEINNTLRIDASDRDRLEENAGRIAMYAGLSADDESAIAQMLSRLIGLVEAKALGTAVSIDKNEMRSLIDRMDALTESQRIAKSKRK